MADKKIEDATINEEQEAKTAPVDPEDKKDEKPAKEPGKIKTFFSKNKKKILTGLGIAGAVGVGIIGDRVGIKIGSGKKKGGDEPGDTAE